ncbi:MAG TPA: YncE family protein [Acidimicrobiales bacterium]|nr:YncE family protein [Acidimicrobiales bacterium]
MSRRAAWCVVSASALVGGLTAITAVNGSASASASSATRSWSTVFVANLGSDSLTPLDPATDVAAPPIGLGEQPVALAVAPGAKTVYVVEVGSDQLGSPGRMVPVATSNYILGKPIGVGTAPQAIDVTPDGKKGYVLNGHDAATTPASTPVTVTPINLVTRSALSPVKVGTLPLSMTMSPNGKLVYVVNSDPSSQGEPTAITPIDTTTDKAGPQIRLVPSAGPFPASGLAFAPDSGTAYAITEPGVVPVHTATGVTGKPIGLHTSMPVAIAVTPNGSTLAEVGTPITAREPGSPYGNNVTLALLSTSTGAVGKVATLGDEPGAVAWDVVISPDGSTAYVLVVTQSPSQSSLVSAQSTVIPVDLATGKAGKPLDVGLGGQALAMSTNGATLYVLVTGPYHASSPHYGPGSVVPIVTATGTLGKPVPVGEVPQALVVSQPLLDQVQHLVASSTVKSQLVAAFAAGWHLKRAQVAGTSGTVSYAYDQTTHTYWAEASFVPASGDPPAMMQDAGAFGVFSQPKGMVWKFQGSSLPITCRELSVVPPAVLELWAVAPTDAAYCRS